MRLIVDVVCHSTGEVLKEGVSLEVVAELKKQAGAAKRSREFWNPMRES